MSAPKTRHDRADKSRPKTSFIGTASPFKRPGRPFEKGNQYGFKPGQSGNAGNRVFNYARFKRLQALIRDATQDGKELAEFFLKVLRNEQEDTRTRMLAGMWLADRGFGKVADPPKNDEEEQVPRAQLRAAWLSLPDAVLEQIISVSQRALPAPAPPDGSSDPRAN